MHRIDPTGYAMLIDFLRVRFDAQAWGAALGAAPASVTDRKYFPIYRYPVYFDEVVEGIAPPEAAIGLVARRLSPGEPTQHAPIASKTSMPASVSCV